MLNLFASPGMTTMTIAVFLVELISMAVFGIGVLSYRSLIISHHEFLSSLHHGEKYAKRRSFGMLAWIYIVSTLFIVLLTGATFVLHPHFL